MISKKEVKKLAVFLLLLAIVSICSLSTTPVLALAPDSFTSGIQISIVKIEREIELGDSLTEQLLFTNNLNSPATITITPDNSLTDIIQVVNYAQIPASNQLWIPIKITPKKEGVFFGNIVISNFSANYLIPVRISVTRKSAFQIDTALVLTKDSIISAESLPYKVSVFNLGRPGRRDVFFTYSVLSKQNQSTITTFVETAAVDTTITLTRTLALPKNLAPGEYELQVTVDSHSQSENSSSTKTASFTVLDPAAIAKESENRTIALIINAIILLLFALILWYHNHHKNTHDITKQANPLTHEHIFPDLRTIPGKGTLIGAVPGLGLPIHITDEQLRRHILITGATGSGKTVFAQHIIKKNKIIPFTIIDTHGTWSEKKLAPLTDAYLITHEPSHLEKSAIINIAHTPQKQREELLKKICSYFHKKQNSKYITHILVIDDAHSVSKILEKHLASFRAKGVCVVLTAHSSEDISKNISSTVGTFCMFHSRNHKDIAYLKSRHGDKFSHLLAKLPVGVCLMENSEQNHGNPFLVKIIC